MVVLRPSGIGTAASYLLSAQGQLPANPLMWVQIRGLSVPPTIDAKYENSGKESMTPLDPRTEHEIQSASSGGSVRRSGILSKYGVIKTKTSAELTGRRAGEAILEEMKGPFHKAIHSPPNNQGRISKICNNESGFRLKRCRLCYGLVAIPKSSHQGRN